MTAFLPLVQLLLTAIVVIWDVVLSGSIAQVRTLPRPFVIITALAGFLLLPALVIHLSSTDAITGRSITDVAWLWPLTVLLFAIQAIYAGVRRLVNPFFGFFIAVYNVIVAADAVLRFVATRGTPLPGYALVGLAATSSAFAFITQSPASIASPLFFFAPMTAPAYPALRPSAATFRGFLGLVAFGWIVVILMNVLSADRAVNSYGTHDSRIEKLEGAPPATSTSASSSFRTSRAGHRRSPSGTTSRSWTHSVSRWWASPSSPSSWIVVRSTHCRARSRKSGATARS